MLKKLEEIAMNIDNFKITVGDILYYNGKRIGLLKNQTGKYKTIFTHQKFDGLKLVGENKYSFEEYINEFITPRSATPKPNPILYQKIYDIISQNEATL